MTVSPISNPAISGSALAPSVSGEETALRQAAQDLEASFLAEMLKHAGFGAARQSFGGGAGEDQFASLMRSEHARAIAEAGGIGLAQTLFDALVARATAERGSTP